MGYCGPRGIPLSTFLSWKQSDQDMALAWAAREGQRCPSCGVHPDDSLDREAVKSPCMSCQEVNEAREELRVRGVPAHWHVRLRQRQS